MKMRALIATGLLIVWGNVLGQTSAAGKVVRIGTGWYADQAGIVLSVPIPNPAGCAQSDQVLLDASTPGYKTHLAVALTAFALAKDYVVVVSNSACSPHGRPALIGSSVQ